MTSFELVPLNTSFLNEDENYFSEIKSDYSSEKGESKQLKKFAIRRSKDSDETSTRSKLKVYSNKSTLRKSADLSNELSPHVHNKKSKKHFQKPIHDDVEDESDNISDDDSDSISKSDKPRRKKVQFKRYEKELPPLRFGGHIEDGVKEILGGSIMDLRRFHAETQRRKASQRTDYDSDSDSEAELSDTIRRLAEEDTTWFQGCGCRFTLDSAILFTQIFVGLIVISFCVIKLLSTDDCSVMSTYAPLLSAVVAYFLPGPNKTSSEKSKKD